jgi:hypothetical protein
MHYAFNATTGRLQLYYYKPFCEKKGMEYYNTASTLKKLAGHAQCPIGCRGKRQSDIFQDSILPLNNLQSCFGSADIRLIEAD